MSASLVIFIIIHVFALGYLIESLRRIAKRAREYPLEETRETLPFGFLRLRHVVILYLAFYAAWVLVSIWLYFVFIDMSLIPTMQSTPSSNIQLNL